jgi:hypothetical protein
MLLAPGVQTVLMHMDEKWFFAIVVRRNNKSVPFLGVAPVHQTASRKASCGTLAAMQRCFGAARMKVVAMLTDNKSIVAFNGESALRVRRLVEKAHAGGSESRGRL